MRIVLALLASLAFASNASAAPPSVSVSASSTTGIAPLTVALQATGDAASYSWELGDGTSDAGPSVRHVYGPGRFRATVTATSGSGETAQAQVEIVVTRRTLDLAAPLSGDYETRLALGGALRPAPAGALVQIYRGATYVTSTRVGANGRFRTSIRLRSPGPYHARYGATRSAERLIRVRPRLVASLPATVTAGGALPLLVRMAPASAGTVRVEVRRDGAVVLRRRGHGTLRLRLPVGSAGDVRVSLVAVGRAGFLGARRRLATRIVQPSLSLGARGPSVLALERRLVELHYALRGVDASYGLDTLEAVTAFQKVNLIARTGAVDAGLWRLLARATVPAPRSRGFDHIEVDKTRQVLFEIRGGEVARIVHVSTGATGNTPLGTWHVYRKVTGFDWVLWYPMYFLRGFAIHGYPSVPAYPASHGCVRVPMWIAPQLFAGQAYGATISIYL